ncbi:coiled-coil domain-containing protein 28B-like isoform X2 [Xenia sp. Carnegie-2017]|uniref:coiled-coil domain-containing protein 28B-like isoform X2 n=1 Tax=Xenia sp. Carnegie-2017 TaxID=2897299 RepID=UPI001F03A7F4|nr:coiled-coil domain-containing protein 28B-like isoform X2 [Xenia sp. Carnegie-2017]
MYGSKEKRKAVRTDAGKEQTLDKMDKVRESQESLAQLHFELDVDESLRKEHEEVGRNRNLEKLMKDLEKLSLSIQNLHQNDQS